MRMYCLEGSGLPVNHSFHLEISDSGPTVNSTYRSLPRCLLPYVNVIIILHTILLGAYFSVKILNTLMLGTWPINTREVPA